MGKDARGRLMALLTILIWGTTFISSKVLLKDFQPVELLFLRFALGFLALLAAQPKRLRYVSPTRELTYAAAGLCGVCLYYLLENIALTYTLASNVGVMISVAPFFTAILAQLFARRRERLHPCFFLGFAVAMAGIALISLNGSKLQLNPLGDLLAVLAALVWACYSLLSRRIAEFGDSILLSTRRIFLYGLLFMIPALFLFRARFDLARLAKLENLLNLLYLGLGASALCFVTWNTAVRELGPVRTSVYIYMTPVITVISSALLLREPLTPLTILGTLLTLAGLLLSEFKFATKPKPSH